jgi:diketogulonate reductase-like aldo/keto reductase|tara:strand:- start:301 stop:1128 length:828 start_codon:yes stop_codon:yes gene_type:complete
MTLTIESRIKLNDGMTMPLFGLGVWRLESGKETRDAVSYALELGYIHIDTASMYNNEEDVGVAIQESSLPREKLFITTKVNSSELGYDSTLEACERSLKKLKLTYLDLFLIHKPVEGYRQNTWKALEKLKHESICRSIGVSNFSPKHLNEIFKICEFIPAVNQIEMNPFLAQKNISEFCRSKNIHITGYCPLARTEKSNDPTLVNIANECGKTWAQVMVRWGLQKQLTTIPKSANPKRIRENSDVFNFELNEKQMQRLDDLDEGFRLRPDPNQLP